jgi:hypothetical protein
VRALRGSQRRRRRSFLHQPGQDGKPVGSALSDRALRAVEAYLKVLGVELHDDAFLFRNRSGAPYSSDTLGDDFRDIRHLQFGPTETRTLADFRRSGARETFAGDALPSDVSHAMGNTITTSNMLFATYNPVNMPSVRKVHEARIKGRRRVREGVESPARRSAGRRKGERNEHKKVGTRRPEKSELGPLPR